MFLPWGLYSSDLCEMIDLGGIGRRPARRREGEGVCDGQE